MELQLPMNRIEEKLFDYIFMSQVSLVFVAPVAKIQNVN